MAWMDIVECADSSCYVGSTTDLQRRLQEHQDGLGSSYTARRRPVKLDYAAELPTIEEAYAWGR